MPTIRGLALGVTMIAAGVVCLPAAAFAAQSAPSGEGEIVVETSVTPALPVPDEPIVQTARVVNTGSALLTRIVVQLDAGPACRWVLPLLTGGQDVTLTCPDVARRANTVLKARARATTELGHVVQATAAVRIEFALPAQDEAAVPPRAESAPPIAPALAPAPVEPTVAAASPVAAVPAPSAPAAGAPPSAPAAGSPPSSTAATTIAMMQPTVRTVGQTGPLATPARTAGVLAILAVVVLTVAVGSIAGAIRVR